MFLILSKIILKAYFYEMKSIIYIAQNAGLLLRSGMSVASIATFCLVEFFDNGEFHLLMTSHNHLAMRSPGLITNGSCERLTSNVISSPR